MVLLGTRQFSSISLIGSTSSGKSTIGNLLIGRYIFPSGVQETTTSIVEIHHEIASYYRPTLILSDLYGVNLKYLKYEQLESDIQIRDCINRLMTTTNSVYPFVQIHLAMNITPRNWYKCYLHYSRRAILGRKPLLAEIKTNGGFTIRDFPGFQHEKDQSRLHLIEKYLSENSLIFFIFNAEETDTAKEDKLLSKLFDLLCYQNRSWQSVLFILNRKDAFHRDTHPEASLNKAIQSRLLRIKKLIKEKWGEIPNNNELVLIPISAGLALATEMLCWESDFITQFEYQYFKDYIDDYGLNLLPDEITDTLPRQMDEWNNEQWLKVYHATHYVSGLHQLIKALKCKLQT